MHFVFHKFLKTSEIVYVCSPPVDVKLLCNIIYTTKGSPYYFDRFKNKK